MAMVKNNRDYIGEMLDDVVLVVAILLPALVFAVVFGSCGDGERGPAPPAPDGCDAAVLAGWWDLGDDFGNCPPYSSRTRLDGGDRPGGQCQVIETGQGGDCRLWVEEVCDVDGAYLHMLTTAGRSTSRPWSTNSMGRKAHGS